MKPKRKEPRIVKSGGVVSTPILRIEGPVAGSFVHVLALQRHKIDARHGHVGLKLACDRYCTRRTEAPSAETPGELASEIVGGVGTDSHGGPR